MFRFFVKKDIKTVFRVSSDLQKRPDLLVCTLCDLVDERRDRTLFGFPDIAAEMFAGGQTAEETRDATIRRCVCGGGVKK